MRIAKIDKPITRETSIFERTDALIVTLHPRHLEIRLKGKRDSITLDYREALDLGRKLAYRRSAAKG